MYLPSNRITGFPSAKKLFISFVCEKSVNAQNADVTGCQLIMQYFVKIMYFCITHNLFCTINHMCFWLQILYGMHTLGKVVQVLGQIKYHQIRPSCYSMHAEDLLYEMEIAMYTNQLFYTWLLRKLNTLNYKTLNWYKFYKKTLYVNTLFYTAVKQVSYMSLELFLVGSINCIPQQIALNLIIL